MISLMNWVQKEEHTKRKTNTVKTNQAYIKYIEMLQNWKVSKIWVMSQNEEAVKVNNARK